MPRRRSIPRRQQDQIRRNQKGQTRLIFRTSNKWWESPGYYVNFVPLEPLICAPERDSTRTQVLNLVSSLARLIA